MMREIKFRIWDNKNKRFIVNSETFNKNKVLELYSGLIDFQNDSIEIKQREDYLYYNSYSVLIKTIKKFMKEIF